MPPPSGQNSRHGTVTAIPCHAVRAAMWLFVDHECSEFQRERLRRHLKYCHSCRVAYSLADTLEQLLARARGDEQAPSWLHAHVLAATVQSESAGR